MRRNGMSGMVKRVMTVVMMVVLCVAGLGAIGCDDGSLYGYGLNFLPDWQVTQDVYDYQQSVYDSANDAWTEYIRM